MNSINTSQTLLSFSLFPDCSCGLHPRTAYVLDSEEVFFRTNSVTQARIKLLAMEAGKASIIALGEYQLVIVSAY